MELLKPLSSPTPTHSIVVPLIVRFLLDEEFVLCSYYSKHYKNTSVA